MSFRSVAASDATRNITIIPISFSEELQKKILSLQEKLSTLRLMQGNFTMRDVLATLSLLQDQWANAKLSAEERLTIEEYKLIIIESCRTALSKAIPAPFKIPKKLRVKLQEKEFRTYFPDLSLLADTSLIISIEHLHTEFLMVREYLKNKKLSSEQKDLLQKYRDFILHSPLYKQGGLTKTYEETKQRESAGKNFWKRISFFLPQVLQIISNGCLYVVELLGKSSLLMLIPNIPNPVAIISSIGLIAVASILDFAFGMKLFKDTYGIAFFGQISKSNLTLCEKQLAATKGINQMLTDAVACHHLSAGTYKEYCDLAAILNKSNKSKTFNPNSEFSTHKENRWIKAIRWGLLGLCALLTVNSSYFAGASLLALATGSALITSGGWIFIVALIASSLALLYLQQKTSTFSLLNPTFERFEALKLKGLKLVAGWESIKAKFQTIYLGKETSERQDLAPAVEAPVTTAVTLRTAPAILQPAHFPLKKIGLFSKSRIDAMMDAFSIHTEKVVESFDRNNGDLGSPVTELPEAGLSSVQAFK
jgi:hypothetical protein